MGSLRTYGGAASGCWPCRPGRGQPDDRSQPKSDIGDEASQSHVRSFAADCLSKSNDHSDRNRPTLSGVRHVLDQRGQLFVPISIRPRRFCAVMHHSDKISRCIQRNAGL